MSTKAELIQKLIRAGSSTVPIDQMFDETMSMLAQAEPELYGNIPKELLDKAKDQLDKSIPELSAPMHKFYDENYNEAELTELYAFLTSSVGRKSISLAPTMMQYTTEASLAIGRKFQSIMEAWQDKHDRGF